jgi:hypothetical protein
MRSPEVFYGVSSLSETCSQSADTNYLRGLCPKLDWFQYQLAPFSHRLAQRDGEGAALTKLATEASSVLLVEYVEEADRAKCSQGGCICRHSSQSMRNVG